MTFKIEPVEERCAMVLSHLLSFYLDPVRRERAVSL
jgi:hypothetical protein